MPHFTLQLSPQGAVVNAGIMVSSARQKMLQDSGQPIPPPQMLRALIDTGASISGVDPSVLAALGLTPTGEADIHTPSTGGTPVHTATYDVCIGILAAREGDLHFISETIQVAATPLEAQGFQALIGTDVLRKCILHYNGADGFFTLAY
jgi:hypothetical protein